MSLLIISAILAAGSGLWCQRNNIKPEYDPPNYRSAMMAFRLCVQRYGRLPQELVVDRGPEFGSVYFESLLSRCFVTKLDRPGQQPHFGSVVERLFGTTTTELLNQLRGNTQASKTSWQMTREVDPQEEPPFANPFSWGQCTFSGVIPLSKPGVF